MTATISRFTDFDQAVADLFTDYAEANTKAEVTALATFNRALGLLDALASPQIILDADEEAACLGLVKVMIDEAKSELDQPKGDVIAFCNSQYEQVAKYMKCKGLEPTKLPVASRADGWLIYHPDEADPTVDEVIKWPIWLTVGRRLLIGRQPHQPGDQSQHAPMIQLLFALDIIHRKFDTTI